MTTEEIITSINKAIEHVARGRGKTADAYAELAKENPRIDRAQNLCDGSMIKSDNARNELEALIIELQEATA